MSLRDIQNQRGGGVFVRGGPQRPTPPTPVRQRQPDEDQFDYYKALAQTPAAPKSGGDGGGGSPFGRGLGFLINNPLTQAVSKPLEILDYGRRAITLGLEEFAEGISGQELKATEGDTRSNMEKLKDPTYGVGQLLGDMIDTPWDGLDKWANRGVGLVSDLALDPLSYFTAGGGSVAGKTARASSLAKLAVAQGDAVRLGDRALVKALGGEADLARIGKRGLGTANAAQAKAMGIGAPGLRVVSPLGSTASAARIPGTEHLGRAVNDVLGRARTPIRKLPGAKALRATRNPVGFLGNDMGRALERIITGEGEGSLHGALATVALDDAAREVGGSWTGVASQVLESSVAGMKGRGLDMDAISDLARRADLGEANEWTQVAEQMRLIAKNEFGVDLPMLSGDVAYGMPHVLDQGFRNDLLEAIRRGDANARAFLKQSGMVERDLLKDSGFLQRRSFRPNADGTPKVLKFGDTEVAIERGTAEELNEKLGEVFPWFEGNIYETNPVVAYQRYISGVGKEVGKRGGGARVAATGAFPNLIDNKTMAPGRFDPYGATEDVFDADGNIVQRTVQQEGGLAEDKFWEATPDDAATAARNKEIKATQKSVLDNLNTYSEAERAAIASDLEDVANELIDPIKVARHDAAKAVDVQKRANETLAGAYNDNRQAAEALRSQVADQTTEIERLAKVKYGIERTAKNRTTRRQKELLSGLDAQRRKLIAERDRLEGLYRRARDLATETDGTPSSIRAARKQVQARVEDAKDELHGKQVMARRNFKAMTGVEPPTPKQYEGAKKLLADSEAKWTSTPGKTAQEMTRNERRAQKTVRQYETWESTLDRTTQVEQQRLRQALREQGEFEAEVKRLSAPEPIRSSNEAPERAVSSTSAAATAKAKKFLGTPQARQVVADRNNLADLQRRGRGKGKAAVQARKEARTLSASLAERSRLGERVDNAQEVVRKGRADAAAINPPRAQRVDTSTPQPDLQAMLRTQQSTDQALAAADRGYIPQIAQTEAELANVKNRQVGELTGTGMEKDAIALEEGMDAIRKRQPVEAAQDRARLERDALTGEAAALDEETGAMISGYQEGLRDVEAMRLEHQRIADELGKGGRTASSPKTRTEELAGKKPSKAGLERVAADEVPPAIEQPLYSVVEDVRRLVQANPLGEDELLTRAEAALFPLERRLSKLTTEADIPAARTEALLKAAGAGELAPVMRAKLRENWTELWSHGDVVLSDELTRIYRNLERIDTEPHRFMRALTTYTNFFKTYATLTPGFHVRNGMSAVFMNYAMGVPTGTQIEGLKLWRRFVSAEDPAQFIAELGKTAAGRREKDALFATFSSGAGGRFFEAGVADATQLSSRMQERVFSNWFTKKSQKFGQDGVEGPVRTSMALAALDAGGDVRGAMQKIDRVHFDYGRGSEFDERAKRLIPFWTFMSRNLPMQLTAMWTNPRTYARYNSFIRNFRGEDVEGTPDYFNSIGAFPLGDAKIAGMPVFLQPDLAHTRLDEDLKNIEDLLSGENVLRPLTTLNPIFTAPVEFATGKDFFTGRQYDETDIREVGTAEKPLQWIAQLLGQTDTSPGGAVGVNEGFLDAMRSINPIYDRAVRLAPQATTGGNAEDAVSRQIESFARWLGIPVRTLSEQQRKSAQKSDYYNQRDEMAMQRALLALDR